MRLIIGLALTILMPAAAARAGESVDNDGIWFCQSVMSSPTATLYVSDHFDGRFDLAVVPNAFKKMIAAKYGADIQPSCSHAYRGPGILEKLKGDNQRWYGQIRAGGGKVVETHWTFAAQAERVSYVCFGGAQYAKNGAPAYSFFHTDAIEMAASERGKLDEAWNAYLAEQHPGWFFPYKGCNMIPSGQTAQSIVASHTQAWMPGKAEIVHVGWTYAPATKSAADDTPSEFCQALRTDNKYWYVTPVFPMASVDEANAAMSAWRVYLRGLKDPEGMSVADSYLNGCDGPGPAKAMKQQSAARAEQIRNGGGKVFETGWLPSGAPTAAAATAQAAAAASAPKTYQCSMGSFGGNYMTPGFQSAKSQQTLVGDWDAYIRKAHPVQGVARTYCVEVTAQQAAAQLAQVGWTRVDWKD